MNFVDQCLGHTPVFQTITFHQCKGFHWKPQLTVVQTNFVILQFCCFSIAFLLLALCWFAFRKKRWLLQFSTDDTCLQICLELNFFVLTVQSLKMFLFCCSRLLCITWLSVKLMANTLIWKPDSRLSRHSKSIEIWFCIMRMCRQQEVSFEEWIEVKYSVCWHHWHVKVFATPGSMLPLITWIVGTAIASISFALLTAHILIRFKATNVCLLVTPGHVKLAGLVCRFFGGGTPGHQHRSQYKHDWWMGLEVDLENINDWCRLGADITGSLVVSNIINTSWLKCCATNCVHRCWAWYLVSLVVRISTVAT